MAARTVRLELTVKYDDQENPGRTPAFEECKGLLDDLVRTAVNRGLISGETDLVVDDYRHQVVDVSVG